MSSDILERHSHIRMQAKQDVIRAAVSGRQSVGSHFKESARVADFDAKETLQ